MEKRQGKEGVGTVTCPDRPAALLAALGPALTPEQAGERSPGRVDQRLRLNLDRQRGSSSPATTTIVAAGLMVPNTSPWACPTASQSAGSVRNILVRITCSGPAPASARAARMIWRQRRVWAPGSGSQERPVTQARCPRPVNAGAAHLAMAAASNARDEVAWSGCDAQDPRRRPDVVAAARRVAGPGLPVGPAPVRCASVPHHGGCAQRDEHAPRPDRALLTVCEIDSPPFPLGCFMSAVGRGHQLGWLKDVLQWCEGWITDELGRTWVSGLGVPVILIVIGAAWKAMARF